MVHRLSARICPIRWTCFLWLALACGLSACCSLDRVTRVDTSGPGWAIQQGEVLWKPGKKYPELAGEVVVASNQDGHRFVEFTKTAFPMAAAQCTLTNWAIAFPPQKMAFCGSGKPPARFGWLQLLRAMRDEPLPSVWRFHREENGRWRLENLHSGESLEGFLSP